VDRHPAAAVTAGLFTLVWMSMMLSVYPLAAAVLLALGASCWSLRTVGRERERRAALAARADYDHAQLMARSWLDLKSDRKPFFPAPGKTPRRRATGHWSNTEPISAGQIPKFVLGQP